MVSLLFLTRLPIVGDSEQRGRRPGGRAAERVTVTIQARRDVTRDAFTAPGQCRAQEDPEEPDPSVCMQSGARGRQAMSARCAWLPQRASPQVSCTHRFVRPSYMTCIYAMRNGSTSYILCVLFLICTSAILK